MEIEKIKLKVSIITIIVLLILVIALGGYIGYDKFLSKTIDNCPEEKVKNNGEEKKSANEILNAFTSKSNGGNYKVYMYNYSGSDSIIILYSPKDNTNTNEQGFFTFIGGSKYDFNAYHGGYYTIEKSTIKFSALLNDETNKNMFINQFQITDNDLKTDEDGYSYVIFNYDTDKIFIANHEFSLITK